MQQALHLIQDGFLKPLCNPKLRTLYIGTVLGVMSLVMMDVYFAYDLASLGMMSVIAYFIFRSLPASITFMPIAFCFLQDCSEKNQSKKAVINIIFSIQVITLVATLTLVVTGYIFPAFMIGAVLGLSGAAFWVFYHAIMVNTTGDNNVGNEAGMAHVAMTIGGFVGALLAGLFLTLSITREVFLLFSIVLLLCATSFLFFFMLKQTFVQKGGCKQNTPVRLSRFFSSPRRIIATMLESGYDSVTNHLWPIWIKMIGGAGIVAASLHAFLVIVKFVISPVAGSLINARQGHDLQYGSLAKLLGWVPWLLSATPMTSIFSSIFVAVGSHMYRVGLESRWYAERSYVHMAAREIYVGLGRIIAVLIFVPILFSMTYLYVPAGIILTMFVYYAGKHLGSPSNNEIFSRAEPVSKAAYANA